MKASFQKQKVMAFEYTGVCFGIEVDFVYLEWIISMRGSCMSLITEDIPYIKVSKR